ICSGYLLGLVPRENVKGTPFSSPEGLSADIDIDGIHSAFLSTDILFEHARLKQLKIAVELGDDIRAVNPPSVRHALSGATLIVRMASFPQTLSSDLDTQMCLSAESRRLACGMLLSSPGRGESTTDNVYSGFCAIAEDGEILNTDEAFGDQESCFAVSEIDIDYLMNVRRDLGCFDVSNAPHYPVLWGNELSRTQLTRRYSRHPHLPDDEEDLPEYCERMIDMQVSGLVKRMEYAGLDHFVVGISGGVDSTLAVMISALAAERLGLPEENVIAVTMPCFGTSSRTKSNAVIVAEQWGCEVRVIDIGDTVYSHFDDIGHAHDDYSIAYENAQARMRTMILMDIANKVNGLDVGTEDLSEYIDGWCTYNGDHTSMYDVNLGLTKTQVRANVSYIASTTDDEVLASALYDVLDCPVTPELLPIHDDIIEQKSEDSVGSYSLQDFFTHKMLVCGFTPSKTFRLAKTAYGEDFSDEELIRWLKSWCRRLFSQQFKRSCLMDGPAVQAFSVSPRNGLHLPSDAEAAPFLEELDSLSHPQDDLFGDSRMY
ncbi:MAG: NAD(+) synthase, partial [Eubacteriales bacterium]|nr:NAD(+) synthase [Eubacteriales bacterium]